MADADSTFSDGLGGEKTHKVDRTAGVDIPYHKEEAAQRTALLAKFDALGALLGAVTDAPASAVTDDVGLSALLRLNIATLIAFASNATPIKAQLVYGGSAIDPTSYSPVFSPLNYVDVTLTADTSALASGDIIADSQVVAACVRENDALGLLHSVVVIDEDDQGQALDLVFLSSNVTVGTENAAPSISDANSRTILGWVEITTDDYKDLGGTRMAVKTPTGEPGSPGFLIKPVAGTDDIYVAAICRSGTPTYTASGLKLRLGFMG